MQASKEQNKVFHNSSDRLSELILTMLNEQGYEDRKNDEMIDPIISAALGVATEFAHYIGYDRGDILEKVCDAIDNARSYEDELMCDHCNEPLLLNDKKEIEEKPKWLN